MPTKGPDGREGFVKKVVERLHRTVVDKLAVRMDGQGLTEAEAAEAAARLRAAVGAWSPTTPDAAERRHQRGR